MSRKWHRTPVNDTVPPTRALAERALQSLAKGDAEGAVKPLQRALREAPDDPDLHALLSQAQYRLGQFDAAEQSIAQAIGLSPDNPDFHGGLGRILRHRGRMVRAVQSFQRAARLQPGHWAAQDLLDARASVSQSIHTWHLPMLADLARNDAFEAAINRAVRSGDVVLDIGTGTGLLAMMAARAGARHVYACEMEPNLADLATETIARNGLADRITVIAKKSTELASLPERASLLITETFDSLLIGEGVLESLEHARAHLLTGDARVLPVGGRIMGQLVTLPRLKTMHPLRRLSGFDFAPLTELALERRLYTVVPAQEAWVPLTDPMALLSFNFQQANALQQSGRVPALYRASGPVHALLLWIELDIDDQTGLSSMADSIHHWKPLAFLLDDGISAEAGAAATIHWTRDALTLHFTVKSSGVS